MFEYLITDLEGNVFTLITANDPSEYEYLDIVTVGEYTQGMTQKDLVLA